jgi:hypothetical protein
MQSEHNGIVLDDSLNCCWHCEAKCIPKGTVEGSETICCILQLALSSVVSRIIADIGKWHVKRGQETLWEATT